MSFIKRWLLKMVDVPAQLKAIEQREEHLKRNAIEIGPDSKLYPESRIYNYLKKKEAISIGEDTHIRGELLVFNYGGKITIGNNCYIGEGTRVWSGEEVLLGNNVLVSHNVNIMDFAHERNHQERAESFKKIIKFGHPTEKGNIPTRKIIIEDDVAIYAGANIIMGVTVGRGSIISAGSVVLRDVPPFSVVVGNPAKVVWKVKE